MASVEIPAISILIGFFLSYLALGAATNIAAEDKASGSIVVTGNVFCGACLEGRPSENGYVISIPSVAVECRLNRKTMMTVSIKGETDEKGEFKVELPLNIFESADQLSMCSVKLLKSPDKSCGIPSKSAPASSLTLQSFVNGLLTYSAGSFSYRHETAPGSCYRKGVLRMKRGRAVAENFNENWKVDPQTYINPDPSLHWGGGGGCPKFPPGAPSGFPQGGFPKFPPGAPFGFPAGGFYPPFPKARLGPPFNAPGPPSPGSDALFGSPTPPAPGSDAPFGSTTPPGSDAPFGPLLFPSEAPFASTTCQYLKSDLAASTTPSLVKWFQQGTPGAPGGVPKFPPDGFPFLRFPPGTPHGFPKFQATFPALEAAFPNFLQPSPRFPAFSQSWASFTFSQTRISFRLASFSQTRISFRLDSFSKTMISRFSQNSKTPGSPFVWPPFPRPGTPSFPKTLGTPGFGSPLPDTPIENPPFSPPHFGSPTPPFGGPANAPFGGPGPTTPRFPPQPPCKDLRSGHLHRAKCVRGACAKCG